MMASTGDRYLPDLAKVFAREAEVFSWNSACNALSQGLHDDSLKTIAESTKAKNILSQKVPTFPPSSASSKNTFEQKTAAISVTPASNERTYDLDQLKADALWLVKEVTIAEDEALRIVVLEWERRPRERLLAGFSETELASIKDSMTGDETAPSADRFFPLRQDDDFEIEQNRRARILEIHLSEQNGLLATSKELQQMALLPEEEAEEYDPLKEIALEVDPTSTTDSGIMAILGAVESRLQALNYGRTWSMTKENMDDIWAASQLCQVQILLDILMLRLRASTETLPAGQSIVRWFRIAAGCEFFNELQPTPYFAERNIEQLHASTALVSLAMLDAAGSAASLSDSITSSTSHAYYLITDVVNEIHAIMVNAAEACLPQAAPAVLGWSLIVSEIRRAGTEAKNLRENQHGQNAIEQNSPIDQPTRRASHSSLQQSVFEDVIDSIANFGTIQDSLQYLLRCAIEADHAFEVVTSLADLYKYGSSLLTVFKMQTLQELLTVSVSVLGYIPDILTAQFSLFEWSPKSDKILRLSDPRDTFIKNDYLMDNVFAVAAARFPYESVPFLRLCRLLSKAQIFDDQGTSYITYRLRSLDSFTYSSVGSFDDYGTIRENENANLVCLNASVNMLHGGQTTLLTIGNDSIETLIIAADTIGEVISDSVPQVVKWSHQFSALPLLGAWLELHYLGQLQMALSSFESPSEVAAEVIELLNSLLRSTLSKDAKLNNENRKQLQEAILSEASAGLEHGSNVADYIFEILEQELQNFRRRPSITFETATLCACVRFLTTFVQIRPDQFWASIGKSNLLVSHGSDSYLSTIVNAVEVPSQSFSFLESCSELYAELVNMTIKQANSYSGAKQSLPKGGGPQLQRQQSTILLTMTQTIYIMFDALPGWTFSSSSQQHRIIHTISTAFRTVIYYANGINDTQANFSSSYKSSSTFLFQQCCPVASEGNYPTSVLKHLVILSKDNRTMSESTKISLQSLLSLAQSLVKLSSLRSNIPSLLEVQLFGAVPLLVRHATSNITTAPICFTLLHDLLVNISADRQISLLGHLGSYSSLSLVEVIRDSQRRSEDIEMCVSTWRLLTTFVDRSQQWLALVSLTGSPPEKVVKGVKDVNTIVLRGKSFMDTALTELTHIKDLQPEVAIQMLEFVIQAQQNWSWTVDAIKAKRDFLPAIMLYLQNTFVDGSTVLKRSQKFKIAALVTDLATTHLHIAKVTRDNDHITAILTHLSWLGENAIEVNGYNSSLHANLKKNFAAKFAGLDIANFKRTGLLSVRYGDEYYYDLSLASELVKLQEGETRRAQHDQSFYAELCRANLNLSLVDAELCLLHSFQRFCVEHCGWLVHHKDKGSDGGQSSVQKELVQLVLNCLKANTHVYPPQQIFENILQNRVDLVVSVLQKLIDAKVKGTDSKSLLKAAWECARFRNASYDQAMINDDLVYWRSILTIILLSLQFHTGNSWTPLAVEHDTATLLKRSMDDSFSTILEIITVVVGHGFKSVVSAIQEQRQNDAATTDSDHDSMISHRDILLILSIFEAILRLSRLPEIISEISDRLISTGIIQSCLLLYSWSHTLPVVKLDNEPIYADLSLQLLATLTSLPPVTEELAVEGVLSRLLSARITSKLQNVSGGANHLDKRPHARFLYNLWATGILPICLNLLHSVGPPIAAEIATFLNQFPNQLERASRAFVPAAQSRSSNTGSITLASASEASTLALISFGLESLRNAGASAAVDPYSITALNGYDEEKKALAEDISDVVLTGSTGLKDRVVATTEKELVMSKEERDGTNLLVAKVQTQLKNALVCLKGREQEDDEK